MKLTASDALALRMSSLLLGAGGPADGRPADVAGVVTWFGAMQAQDLASGLWSLGSRLPAFDVGDVTAALERREALRTWPMRGTVHLVPSRDAHWMLDLMGARPLAGATARRAYLGMTDETAERAVEVLGETLAGGRRLTRTQCLGALADAGISGAGQFGYHLLWYASQRGVTCLAPNVGTEQTFVLLDEWVPHPRRLDRDESLATIAERYFRSHGPATRADFAGWTGLTAAEARLAITMAGDALRVVDVEGREMYAARDLLDGLVGAAVPDIKGSRLALPGFDEFMLGFKDRTLMLEAEHLKAIVPGGNGVFRSTIVRDGRVVATWTRTGRATKTLVDVHPLTPVSAAERKRIETALRPYGRFIGQPIETRWA